MSLSGLSFPTSDCMKRGRVFGTFVIEFSRTLVFPGFFVFTVSIFFTAFPKSGCVKHGRALRQKVWRAA